MHVLDSSSRFV